jgi:hypothetical protein
MRYACKRAGDGFALRTKWLDYALSYAKAVALRDYTYQNTILARVDGV